ncbi:GDP-fucose protein O-fucosyltransferase 1 [Achroia grisella]|uniref:GDP-fucose protein O-fucosyltransferase 1 n=1 Tax=Achroia grisella TaxID=688607 RepID=UPI0027D1F4AA|nr:GDP-fucose protein O-fucosyltransferase 1 [Achroia grisella]
MPKSILFISLLILSRAVTLKYDKNGYIAYCPCMGRFGNQADHFLGALAFSKGVNRTLILPPWIEYRFGESKSVQVPFDTYFRVDLLKQYHSVITMNYFMEHIASTLWPKDKRISFCYTKRGQEGTSCNAKSGNPFGPFWDSFNIDFVGSEFYGPLNYDAHNVVMMEKWKLKYSSDTWPVLAFTGAPASFPVQKENLILQKYMTWNGDLVSRSKLFIKKYMSGGGFLGIHLRNGKDWVKACHHVQDSPTLFSAPQCVGYKNERGPLTLSMCFPEQADVIKQVKRALKKLEDIKYLFIASDSNHMVKEFNSALDGFAIKTITLHPSNPHLDLAILGQANYFIGNCVSSFTAFVKRERDVQGLPSEFWSFPHRKKMKHEDL